MEQPPRSPVISLATCRGGKRSLSRSPGLLRAKRQRTTTPLPPKTALVDPNLCRVVLDFLVGPSLAEEFVNLPGSLWNASKVEKLVEGIDSMGKSFEHLSFLRTFGIPICATTPAIVKSLTGQDSVRCMWWIEGPRQNVKFNLEAKVFWRPLINFEESQVRINKFALVKDWVHRDKNFESGRRPVIYCVFQVHGEYITVGEFHFSGFAQDSAFASNLKDTRAVFRAADNGNPVREVNLLVDPTCVQMEDDDEEMIVFSNFQFTQFEVKLSSRARADIPT